MNAHMFASVAITVLLLGAAALVWSVARGPGGRKRWLLAALRAIVALSIALMILQPQCRRSELISEKPVLGVLIDGSQSMRDGPPGATRADIVKKWLATPAFRKAREEYDLRFFTFDKALRDASPEQVSYDGVESRVGDAMREWAARWSGDGAAGLVILSDGLDTTGSRTLAVPGVPCWALEVEKPDALARQRIVLWQIEPPRRALAGSESAVRVVMQGWGVEGREVPVEWWMEGRKVGERRVRFGPNGDVVEASLAMPPLPPGTYPFELRIPDDAAEPSARVQPFVLTVRQEGRSILLLQNTLGFEGKFLRRALSADRNVRLDSYTRWQDGGWARFEDGGTSTNSPPATLDLGRSALAARAVVILSDVQPGAQGIASYVDRGGGLVLLGGPNLLGNSLAANPLAKTVPVPTPAPYRDGRFPVRMTEAGARHPVFGPLFAAVGNFPALQTANLASGVAPNSQVLMEMIVDGQARPLVVVKRQGDGRVAAILSDTLWRWRVAAGGWTGRMSPYDTIWTQLIDWLAPDAAGYQSQGRLEITTDSGFYRQGDHVEIRAEWMARGAAPFKSVPVSVKTPQGQTRAMILQPASWDNGEGGRVQGFRGEWVANETGLHTVEGVVSSDAGETRGGVRFAVATSLGERRGEPADASGLRHLAEASGGRYFTLPEADQWLDSLPKAKHITRRDTVRDVWNHPLLAGLLLASLCCEWWLRRRSGLQ
jgi:chitodextrinase